jgi:predicted deacetylase
MLNNIKKFISQNTGFLIRLDDIAKNMNWDMIDKCEILFDSHNIKPVLGVIPNNQDYDLKSYPSNEKFWDRIRAWKQKGWEISIHGYSHVYGEATKKKDFFGHGGISEFYGLSFEQQKEKIKKAIKKFQEEEIQVRSFFAPNHSYDHNTLKALKECGIKNIIDGYGLMPYSKMGLNFIPQLFYKLLILPFGIQSSQLHINDWKDNDFDQFSKFITKNSEKIITFNQALLKINNSMFYRFLNISTEKTLKLFRTVNEVIKTK